MHGLGDRIRFPFSINGSWDVGVLVVDNSCDSNVEKGLMRSFCIGLCQGEISSRLKLKRYVSNDFSTDGGVRVDFDDELMVLSHVCNGSRDNGTGESSVGAYPFGVK